MLHAAHHTTWLASNCPNCSQLPWTSILTHSYCYFSWNIELCLGFDETPPTVGVSTYISVGTSSIQEIDSNSLIGTYSYSLGTWYLYFYNTYVLSQSHSLQVLELEFILLRILLPSAHSHEVLCSSDCVTSLCSCLRRKPSMKIVGHVLDILSIILEEDRRWVLGYFDHSAIFEGLNSDAAIPQVQWYTCGTLNNIIKIT